MFITPIENFRFHAMCFQEPLNRIKELLSIERVETFVLGLPLFPSGDPCEMTEIVYSFAKMLQENFPEIEIVYQDERYSTIEASNNLSKLGQNKGTNNVKSEIMAGQKQVMDLRSNAEGITTLESNEQQRNWTQEHALKKVKDPLSNYDQTRFHLNFEVVKGGIVQPIDTSKTIAQKLA